MTKLKTQIHFKGTGASISGPDGAPLQILSLSLEEEYRLYDKPQKAKDDLDSWLKDYPLTWAETGGMGLAIQQPPLVIELKTTATPVSIKQYPMCNEAYQGTRPHIKRLLDHRILTPCRSL